MPKDTHTTIVDQLERWSRDIIDETPDTFAANLRDDRYRFRDVSAANGGGRNPYLVTTEDASAKLAHNADETDRWVQGITYLAPARLSGVNLCTASTRGCRAGCLGTTSGRLRFDTAQRAQYVRSRLLIEHPDAYIRILADELRGHAWDARRTGKRYAYRHNGTSDLMIENAPTFLALLESVGVDRFVDYSKHPGRRGWVLPNYYVAASVSERTESDQVAPGSVVVVDVRRNEPLPATYNGHPVANGDAHDLRFLDAPDAVTLLRAKGALVNVIGTPAGMVKPAEGY